MNNFEVIKVHVPEDLSDEDWEGAVRPDGTVVTAITGLPDNKIQLWKDNSKLEAYIKKVSATEFSKRK